MRLRSRVAMFKGASLCVIGVSVLAFALWRVFAPLSPEPFTMSMIGVLALLANVLSVILLYRWRLGDANIRSVWLCSRNDAIGNLAVIGAAVAVFYFASPWPDLIVAILMSGLFLNSAWQIMRQARLEVQQQSGHPPQSGL